MHLRASQHSASGAVQKAAARPKTKHLIHTNQPVNTLAQALL
jgi:hypothetical protein